MRARQLTFSIAASFLCSSLSPAAPPGWVVARSPHFEVYSQAGANSASRAIVRFEELRSFFEQNKLIEVESNVKLRPPLRVIGFSSPKEYTAFAARDTVDAYYVGTEDRDYIVMPMLKSGDSLGTAAHEYAHAVLYSRGLKLPAWLNEGIAELFSTVRISDSNCEFGGPLGSRVDALNRRAWLSPQALFETEPHSKFRETRQEAATFYAESWALTDMLNSAPAYAPLFSRLIQKLNATGKTSQQALVETYGKGPDVILRDVKIWISQAKSRPRTIPTCSSQSFPAKVSPVSERQARSIIADLLFVDGQWTRSEDIYTDLLSSSPADPEVLGALGALALRRNNPERAIDYFRRALDNHLQNAALCYRYALLADERNLSPLEIRRALEQAILIQPGFDDARYKLALLENNAGEFAAAVTHLQRMAQPSRERAFSYWTAMAYALTELDRRDEAKDAAQHALQFAATPEERARASELTYVAATDLTVRFSRDTHGNLQLITSRVPHGTLDFNPFIEPGENVETVTGKLKELRCEAGRLTGLLVESSTGKLWLAIPDPLHILVKNGPSQFYCGPQGAQTVKVTFAIEANSPTGLLRGMDFQ